MKKSLCILLAIICVLGLSACNSTVEDVTVEELIEKNGLENILNEFDSFTMSYIQYDADDNVKSSSKYYYGKDNYGYLFFNAEVISNGYQELKSLYTAKNGAVYSTVSGMTELSVFENTTIGCEDYIASSVDHFDLDFEETIENDGDYYLVNAKKITKTYYMYLKQEAVYYFDPETYVLKKIEIDATDEEGDLEYRAEIEFKYGTEAPTDTADLYFTRPGEKDSVIDATIIYNPGAANTSTQKYKVLKSSLIRGATIDGVEYSVYKDAACTEQISSFSDLDEGATTVYIIPTPEEEESSAVSAAE